MESSESGSCIHKEIHQYPACGIEDLFFGKISAVALVNCKHYLVGNALEFFLTAIVIIYNSGSRLCITVYDESALPVLILASLQLTLMMIKRNTHSVIKRQIGRYIIRCDLNLSILNVLGMHKFDLIDEIYLLEEHRTNKSVKITSCNKSLLHHTLRFRVPLYIATLLILPFFTTACKNYVNQFMLRAHIYLQVPVLLLLKTG
ncbi:MAG: hypothetical protein BWY61_01335 [Firmicutes bacterium ADurb.Bin354]|nr:MAG: hypothetical protein BWY61_01335 [Firmicutes bacterium ADurb.Bin354]